MTFLKTERNPERNEIHSGATGTERNEKIDYFALVPQMPTFPKPTFTERKPERNEKNDRNSGKNGIGTEFRLSLVVIGLDFIIKIFHLQKIFRFFIICKSCFGNLQFAKNYWQKIFRFFMFCKFCFGKL